MKKAICIITGTRAEYGLLRPVIKRLHNEDKFEVRIAATGMHLSEEFGFTYKEIEADGFSIDTKIHVLQNDDTNESMSIAIGVGVIGFAKYFVKRRPDMLILLVDRF